MNVDVNQRDVFVEYCKEVIRTLKSDVMEGVNLLIAGDIDETLYIEFFENNGIIPENVYDRSPKLHGKKCHFGEIINVEDISRLYQEIDAVVVVPYYDEICEAFRSSGIKVRNTFFLDVNMLHLHPTIFLDGARGYISEHFKQLEAVYDRLYDSESKDVWEDILNYWISGNYDIVKKYKGKQGMQYLDFFENWGEHEVFLNCGSFDARYSVKFIELVNAKYDKIINVECDSDNFETTKTVMRGYHDIENINVGLHSRKGKLYFNALGNGTSYISNTKDGAIEIDVDTIDNIVENTNVSFIKMDIEGAEYEAIKGAERTIKRCSPRLAICIYHNVFDFLRIPKLISSFDRDYKFAVRHYTDTVCETVLFGWVE